MGMYGDSEQSAEATGIRLVDREAEGRLLPLVLWGQRALAFAHCICLCSVHFSVALLRFLGRLSVLIMLTSPLPLASGCDVRIGTTLNIVE